jgi:hypothetical protein
MADVTFGNIFQFRDLARQKSMAKRGVGQDANSQLLARSGDAVGDDVGAPQRELNLDDAQGAHCLGPPGGLGAHLRQAHGIKLALIHELLQSTDSLLHRDVLIHAGGAKDVHLLGTAQHAVAFLGAGTYASPGGGWSHSLAVGTRPDERGHLGCVLGILLEIPA